MARPALPAACRNSRRASATACSSTPTSTELTATATGDARQAGGLAQPIPALHLHHRGPRRRARHARVQLRARRPARRNDQGLPDRQGRRGRAHEDDQLRQGAPGGGLQRHLLLVAEPPRGHRARRRRRKLTRKRKRAAGRPNLRLTFGRPLPMLSQFARQSGERRRAADRGFDVLTPLSRLRRASAVVVCLGLFGAPSARAFDLNPFHSGAPQQTAQSTLPPAAIPGAPADAADANDAGALDVRIDRLEDELRQANGRIEELENQQHRLEDQLKRFQQDVEFRLGGAGAGANPVAATPPAAAAAVPPRRRRSPRPRSRPRAGAMPSIRQPIPTQSAPRARSARRRRARRSPIRLCPPARRSTFPTVPIRRPRRRADRSSPTPGRRSSPASASASPTARATSTTRRSRPIAAANTRRPRSN